MPETLINGRWTLDLLPHRASIPSWGWWERERLAAMYTAIRPGDTVMDIGAEQGDLSALYASWVGPAGNMILVEPSAGFWPCIKATFEMNDLKPPRISFPGFAFNDHSAEKWNTWCQYTGGPNDWPIQAYGEIDPTIGFAHINEHPPVPDTTIDDIASSSAFPIDVITMDVEGTEYEVLQGAEDTLTSKPPNPIVFVSVHPEFMMREHGHTTDALHLMMHGFGYDAMFLATDHEQHWMYKKRVA